MILELLLINLIVNKMTTNDPPALRYGRAGGEVNDNQLQRRE